MKNAARLVSMIVVALSVALMEKSWVSLAFKSISTVAKKYDTTEHIVWWNFKKLKIQCRQPKKALP
ncbi:hypothetical protein MUP77_24355 [Candidatus Bathyarchaeota archaeon]|nr:hypothetical protein [Candidatus Bathyarchaeota archaeon]